MNEAIRKNNLLKNEKGKSKIKNENGELEAPTGTPFNILPWGGDQTQFRQETIDRRSSQSKERKAATPSPFKQSLRDRSRESTSKSDKGAIGLDFLDLKSKNKKKCTKRKRSYQNSTNEKHIEIEEKDSIEVNHNKVSFEQVKKTVIYNKTERKRLSKDTTKPKKSGKKGHNMPRKMSKHKDSIIKVPFNIK